MTYTIRRYRSYQEYLDDGELPSEKNYRLLSTGELIELANEDDGNLWLAGVLLEALVQAMGVSIIRRARLGNKEIQVRPTGDKCVNRKPDLLVMETDQLESTRQAFKIGMSAPEFVAEVVSPGNESSDNYLRDYVWKRQQYEDWQILEYWILDAHQGQITVLTLVDEKYQEVIYRGDRKIISAAYPLLNVTAQNLLSGDI